MSLCLCAIAGFAIMRLDRLQVKNFRCFADRAFKLHPHFNVLIGDNGTGKTAALRALRVAVASWFLGIKNRHSVGIRSEDVRLVGRAFETGEYTFEEQYPVEVAAAGAVGQAGAGDSGGENVEWRRMLNGPSGKTTRKGARTLQNHAAEADANVREGGETTLPVLAYYSTSRLYLAPRRTERRRNTPDKRSLSRFVGYRDCIDKRLDSKALEQWLKRQSQIAWEEGRDSTLYRLVRHAIAQMIEGAEDVRYDPKRAEVIVAFDDEMVYPLSYLSDGQRTTLTLAGDLAVRMVRLNPQLGLDALDSTPGVVLIDELDMHLHPTWQRHVAADFMAVFPRVQFIATTHSPQVVSEIDDGTVFDMTRSQDGVEVKKENAYGLDTNWVLKHVMGAAARPEVVQRLFERAEHALAEENYRAARNCLDQIREKVRRPIGEATELRSKVDTLEMLSEEKNHE